MEKPFLSIEEVAEYLGVEYQLIYKQVRAGKLPALKVGRVYRVRRSELEEYIKQNTSGNMFSGQCDACGKNYSSRQMLKYNDTEDPDKIICVDCWERKGIRTTDGHK